MPNLTTTTYNTDTRIEINSSSINSLISLSEIIQLNILDLIVGSLSIPSGSTFIIDTPLTTATLVNKYGQGTLWLSASYNNPSPGAVKIYEGTVIINNSNNALDGTIEISTKNNASLRVENNSTNLFTNTINYATPPIGTPSDPSITFATSSIPTDLYIPNTLWVAGSVIVETGQKVIVPMIGQYTPSPVVVRGELVLNSSVFNNVPYVISGSGIVRIIGTGTYQFLSPNTYSGGTYVENGTLVTVNSFAAGTGPIYVSAGGTLDMDGYDLAPRTIYSYGGTILNDASYTGQIINL